MSDSSLQVLLHAGEVQYIVKTIEKTSPRKNEFVGGCLFGLWRNSLKQPVIQFVTGPGEKFNKHTSIKKMFDNPYVEDCAKIMKDGHCLLHLGFWFSGSQEDQDKAKELVLGGRTNYSVLLFINLTRETNNENVLTGEYHLKKGALQSTSKLFKEDVLDGHSSFRLYEPLTRRIKDALVSPMLGDSSDIHLDIQDLIKKLPSRVQVEEAVTNEAQWYSSDEGMQRLQLLFQYFGQDGIEVGMSRDAVTHNFQFDVTGGYCLDFPVDFPKRMPVLRAPDGGWFNIPRRSTPDEDVCRTVVEVVRDYLRNQSRGRGGNRR